LHTPRKIVAFTPEQVQWFTPSYYTDGRQRAQGFYEAELYRLKGELLRCREHGERPAALVPDSALGGPDSPEECLLKAIEVARGQDARSLELRAVVSMSRFWREQGREADARRMLVDACGGFTEGFESVDLREAQALLNAM
jgi:hypothetical protein